MQWKTVRAEQNEILICGTLMNLSNLALSKKIQTQNNILYDSTSMKCPGKETIEKAEVLSK